MRFLERDFYVNRGHSPLIEGLTAYRFTGSTRISYQTNVLKSIEKKYTGSIPNLFIGGLSMAVTWWIAGIPYDIIHCVSNFFVTLILFKPLCKIMSKVTSESLRREA